MEPPQEPSSSLPSPPASSPALRSPHHSPGPAPSPSLVPLEHRRKHTLVKPRSSGNISRGQTSPHLAPSELLQGQNPLANQITTFASLSSPELERPPYSFEIPDSPSFSSLVERPNKPKMISNIADSVSCNKTHADQPSPLSLLHPPSISFDSQTSVGVQLTPTEQDGDDIDQAVLVEEDLDIRYHSSNGLLSQAQPSQHAEEYSTSDPTSQNQSNGHYHLPVMSQPPSQLRLDSEFPLHLHDHPRGSTSRALHTIHTGLDPGAAMPLSPPSRTSSPPFAVSTPLRQNWYQPPLKRRKRSTCNDKISNPSPLKTEASVSQTKSKKMFDSGTLQITPTSLSKESKAKYALVDAPSMDIDSPANCQNHLASPDSPYDMETFSQSSQDLSYEINSYPALQSQAPYQSQSLTQF